MSEEVRIRLPRSISQGEVIIVRALVSHPMDMLERDSSGSVIARDYNYIHSVTVTFNDREVMKGDLTQSISTNPYLEFPLRVTEPGVLTISFEDTTGAVHSGSVEVKF